MEKQPSSTWGRGGKFPRLPAGSRRAGDAGGAFPLPDPQLGLGRARRCDTEGKRRRRSCGARVCPTTDRKLLGLPLRPSPNQPLPLRTLSGFALT